jgi:hypothetical protein
VNGARPVLRIATLLLHTLALAVLMGALFGVRACSDRSTAPLAVLVDRSASADRVAIDAAVARVLQDCATQRIDCATRDFGGDDPARSDLAAALDSGLPARRLLLVSDGFATAGDTGLALESLQAAGIEVLWLPVAARADRPRIADWSVPGFARTGATLAVEARVAAATTGLQLEARLLEPAGDSRATGAVGADGRARLALPFTAGGNVALELRLLETATGRVLDVVSPAATVGPAPADRRVLHAGPAGSTLAESLRRGGWPLASVRASALDALAPRLGDYEAVILEDVPIAAASASFWSALQGRLRAGETGLVATGLRGAWSAGGYRGSTLESLLPLESVPAALDEAAQFVFALDKSGSMGERSAGVDRFALARSAVLESLRRLEAQDRAAVLAFDVEARPIVPMLASAEALVAAQRPWPVEPRGGTSLRTGLDAALALFEAGDGRGRRVLVLVTDGFVGEEALGALPERLVAERVEVVALAIGADADVAALGALTRRAGGDVLAVGEAAQLPVLMRSGIDRLRMPVELDVAVAPVRIGFGPFAAGAALPPLAAHAVLRAREGATVAIESARGDPLLAFGGSGLGRVAAVATGFGDGAPQWLDWPRWPEFAAALLEAVRPRQHSPGLRLRVSAQGPRHVLELEHAADADWAPATAATLTVAGADGHTRTLPMRAIAPGRYRAELPVDRPGLQHYAASAGIGRASLTVAHRAPRELDAEGVAREWATWIAAGWVRPYSAAALAPAAPALPVAARDNVGVARATLAALLLFLLGVLLERGRELLAGWRWLRARGAALALAAQRAWASSSRRP